MADNLLFRREIELYAVCFRHRKVNELSDGLFHLLIIHI